MLAVIACLMVTGQKLRADQMLVVIANQCEGLDEREVSRLLSIELDMAKKQWPLPQLSIELSCTVDHLRIIADDPLTRKRLTRSIPLPYLAQPGAEREIALASSQLFVASWLELLIPKQDAQLDREADPAVVKEAKRSASQAIGRKTGYGQIALLGSARFRPIESFYPYLYIAVQGAGWTSERFGVFGYVTMETSTRNQEIGQVKAFAGLVGVGVVWRQLAFKHFSLDSSLVGAAGYAYLKGEPKDQAVKTDGVGGVTGEITLSVTPLLWFDRVGVGLSIQAGFMTENPIGSVRGDHRTRVSMGGFLFGGGLVIAVGL
ncbi:MAG: hypothetical protein QNJ97_20875 [Myxococcota bacterium]|nr:hypothetical protein [Myxococcota bacterium]